MVTLIVMMIMIRKVVIASTILTILTFLLTDVVDVLPQLLIIQCLIDQSRIMLSSVFDQKEAAFIWPSIKSL